MSARRVVAPMTVNLGSLRRTFFSARPFAHHDVQHKIFHSRVKDFFDGPAQAVDFVDEQDVTGAHVGEDGRQIAGSLNSWPGRDADVDVHFIGDDVGQGGFTQAGRAMEKHMV